jgi:tryptophan halogenase
MGQRAKEQAQATPGGNYGSALIALLRELPIEGFERSFKMSAGLLLGDRYLLGVQKNAVSEDALLGVCQRMRMPSEQRTTLREDLFRASTVHFGFEQGDASSTYKVYLEFAAALGPATRTGDEVLLHLAYKWDAANPCISTVAKYLWYPAIAAEELARRHAALYPDRSGARSAVGPTREIIDLALRRAGGKLMYLEVSEEGNPRRSFDVNLHDAGLLVEDIELDLAELRQKYRIPPAQFDPLFAQVRGARLAHLSGGIGRHGQDFVTVYYEAEAP